MPQPYRKYLEKLDGQKVTIDRADAPSVSGKLTIDEDVDDGCTILVETDVPEYPLLVYIDYKDIRGVSTESFQSF